MAGGWGLFQFLGLSMADEAHTNFVVNVIERGGVQVISAKELHRMLGVGKFFGNWLKERVGRYKFVEGEDYWPCEDQRGFDLPNLANQKTGQGGDRRSQDYWLTLGMAKELAMLDRSEVGRRARRYFLECERKYLESLGKSSKADDCVKLGAGKPDEKSKGPRLTVEGEAMFMAYKSLAEEHVELVRAMEFDMYVLVLPYVLNEVLSDMSFGKKGGKWLLGYGGLLVDAKRMALQRLTADDVAYRIENGRMPEEYLAAVMVELEAFMAGRSAGIYHGRYSEVIEGLGIGCG